MMSPAPNGTKAESATVAIVDRACSIGRVRSRRGSILFASLTQQNEREVRRTANKNCNLAVFNVSFRQYT